MSARTSRARMRMSDVVCLPLASKGLEGSPKRVAETSRVETSAAVARRRSGKEDDIGGIIEDYQRSSRWVGDEEGTDLR